jgi:hypothetical protein
MHTGLQDEKTRNAHDLQDMERNRPGLHDFIELQRNQIIQTQLLIRNRASTYERDEKSLEVDK